MLKNVANFINEGIWNLSLESKSRWVRFAFKQLRIVIVSIKGFNEDQLILRASSLTFYSILSIVPVIAMLFGIAKGFHLEEELRAKIMQNANYNADIWKRVIEFAETMLNNTQGGLVAGFGIIVLLWSVMRLFLNMETSFNDIWQVNSGRSWIRKFTDYFSLILITPILFIISSSATIYVKTQFTELSESFALLGFFGPLVNFLFRLTPYVLIWLTFTLLYMIMPNTKVKFTSALVAGIVAGTGFQIFEWAYITFQVGVTRYNAIYGSFAALPMFLIWLQTSWLIVLMGAEIAFANQNISDFEREQQDRELNARSMKLLCLYTLYLIYKRFANGESPKGIGHYASDGELSIRNAQKAINMLEQAELVVPVEVGSKEEVTYVPHHDVGHLSIGDVELALEQIGESVHTENTPQLAELEQLMSNRKTRLKDLDSLERPATEVVHR